MSSDKRNVSALMDKGDSNCNPGAKKVLVKYINDIPDIDELVLTLTSKKINDFIQLIIKCLDDDINTLEVGEKLRLVINDCRPLFHSNVEHELYYDEKCLLKKYFFVFLSFIIHDQYRYIYQNSEFDNINLRHFLYLIEKNNILGNFEIMDNDQLNSSSYFSLFGTFLNTIISQTPIVTQDICLVSIFLQDEIIDRNISNWPILKTFIELFRAIIHVDFVKKIYMELLNKEKGSTNFLDDIHFTGK
jgi:hypothetical protein